MKLSFTRIALLAMLFACAGCSNMQMPFSSPSAPVAKSDTVPPAPVVATDSQCNSQAQNRMAMIDRPSTYPLSDKERQDAFTALYTECMHEHTQQIVQVSHNNVAANDAAQLSNLSPAAGGIPPRSSGPAITTSTTPNATVVVVGGTKDNASQLASLNPSSGSSNYPGATVVLVQAQQPQSQTITVPSAIPPVAVPVPPVPAPPPMAKGYVPVAPATPVVATASSQPAENSFPSAPSQPVPLSASTELENVLEK